MCVSRALLNVESFEIQDHVRLEPIASEAVQEGEPAAFMCKAKFGRDVQFAWTKDGLMLKANSRMEISNSKKVSVLSIESVSVNDSGSYTCIASNDVSEERQYASLTVKGEICILWLQRGSVEARKAL